VVSVYNATCARYFIRVVLRGGRPLVDSGPLETGVDAATE
jgi:hypothetical protein